MTWNPELYRRYDRQRFQPALDLLSRVEMAPGHTDLRIFDLGCGAGNISRELQVRWPDATIVGIDNSPEMLKEARAANPGIEFRLESIEGFRPGKPADLLYSNAALHWVPDHGRLVPDLLDQLAEDGLLAIQMPQSWGCASHRGMREVLTARSLGPRALCEQLSKPPVAEAAYYEELLRPLCQQVEVWSTTYYQRLTANEQEHPVLTWVSSTGLRPILEELGPKELTSFLEKYREVLESEYPRSGDGSVLFPFPRLFIVARR